FGIFVAAQGDMRSELWVCALARSGDPCGSWRVHRDTTGQQLRLLVRDRRLHLARGLKDLEHDPKKHALRLRPDGCAAVYLGQQTLKAFARRSCSIKN